jgi:pilus assembly protein CpaC
MNPKMNRLSRRMMQKLIGVAGAAAVGLSTLVTTPALADAPDRAGAAPATRPAGASASSARANRLIADGVTDDGKINLTVNKTLVITTTQPYKQVSVGQADIADVNLISPTTILVTAKKQGSTQLMVWNDKDQSQVADIYVNMDVASLQGDLNAMFPGIAIKVTPMNGGIALQGQVPDLATAEKAQTIAAPYSQKVMNLLEVGGGQQVMLQVKFAEVSRRATNALGVNFAGTDGIFSFGSNVGNVANSGFQDAPGTAGALQTSTGTGVTLFGSGAMGNVAFRYFVNALRQNNLLRILAEPNLTAISGQEASFLAGGEFPIPVPQSGVGGGSTITIDYKEFGVRLKFVPIVLGDGRIRLKMSPEVSDLDFSSPLIIQGSNIPIVNKRTVTTTVELADGQTFAIAGLLNNNMAATRDVTPLLGDLPVLGQLFRSTRYTRQETELVVLVTPKLVEAMNPNQIPAVPGETWRHPKEADIFISGDIGSEQPARAPGAPGGAAAATGAQGAAAGTPPKYRGAYGFTPPPRATTTGSHD